MDSQGQAHYVPVDELGRRIQHLSTYLNTLYSQQHLATPAQKEAIRRHCQQRGWNAEQLQTRLQRQQTNWKTLTQAQASRLLDELELVKAPAERLTRSA